MFPHLLWTFDARTADNSKRLGTFGAIPQRSKQVIFHIKAGIRVAQNFKKVKYSMFPHLLWTFDARTADNSKRLGTFGAAVVSSSYLGQVVSSKYQTNITINAE